MVKKNKMGAVVAAALLINMSSVSAEANAATQHASPANSTVTIQIPQFSTLDPAQWGGQFLVDQGTLFEGLVGYNRHNQIEPKIATHWTTSDGGRVWTFYLRHNARWSNGKPVTAEDFYYAWMRLASPKDTTGAIWSGVMSFVLNAWSYNAGGVPSSKVGLKVVNPYELRITLGSPHNILGRLALAASMPLYPPSVQAHPNDWYMPGNFVGDGPYVVKSFVSNGELSMVRNPDYVGAAHEFNVGNVQQINLVPQSTVPVEDYMANKADTALIQTPSDYQYVLTHPQLKAQLHVAPLAELEYLEWDKSVVPSPLNNALVRQAISMSIARAPIVKSVLNGLGGATSKFGFPGWPTDSGQTPLPYNVAKAQALLAKAGYPNGKGIPTLHLYCQTGQNWVSVAEAISSEIKQNLNINFEISPLAPTLYGNVTWAGLNQGIQPGYNLANAVANWVGYGSLPLQANEFIPIQGTIGPYWYMKHISNWYFPAYDPADVALWGNPTDASMGTQWSQWKPLEKSALADINYLNAWTKRQPLLYREDTTAPGALSLMDIWNTYVQEFKTATTSAAKHQAWVLAWKFAGNYSKGNGNASVGLQGQVFVDQHIPLDVHMAQQWSTEEMDALSPALAIDLTEKIDNFILDQGYGIPIYYFKNFYLEKPGLHGVQTNPYAWNAFYQFQYMTLN